MKSLDNEEKDVLELRDKIKRNFLGGTDVEKPEQDSEYLSLCYGVSRLDYPYILFPLGIVLYVECNLFLREGFPEGLSQGHGDAIVYWILSDGTNCVNHKSVLKKISLIHLEIISSWLKRVALPLYARLCFSEIKTAEKIIETLRASAV